MSSFSSNILILKLLILIFIAFKIFFSAFNHQIILYIFDGRVVSAWQTTHDLHIYKTFILLLYFEFWVLQTLNSKKAISLSTLKSISSFLSPWLVLCISVLTHEIANLVYWEVQTFLFNSGIYWW